jgi:superfamily II DNA or RNA helicase
MVQTVSRHLDRILTPQLIITDEAHHSTASTYRKIYDTFPEALRLGFTATPCRLNAGGLGEVYTDLITSVSTQWLIENHYLAPYKYYSVKLADTSGLHIRAGDYKADEVAALMQNSEIYGGTVEQWERLARGKKTIVYCASVEAARMTAAQFIRSGYPAASLDGSTPPEARRQVMESFRRGDTLILCNCELFGEGLDVPDCECTVLLRPTQSLTLYIQQSMRSMRYMPDKTAIIIDHVGNCYLHGLPDDNREWTLEPKKKQENIVKIRECKECFAVYPPSLDKCPYCGAPAVKEVQRKDKKVVDIDLVEMKRQDDIRSTRLADAQLETWAEVVEFQKLHGYKFAWAIHYASAHEIPIPPKYNYMRRIIGA